MVVTLGARLYVIGGYNAQHTKDQGYLRALFAYDPSTDSWSKTTLLPRRPFFQAVASDGAGNIYNIGGLETRHVYELTVTP